MSSRKVFNSRGFRNLTVVSLAFIAVMILTAHPAMATQTTGLPWEGPLAVFTKSLTGPVAFSIAIGAFFVTGVTLVFGRGFDEIAQNGLKIICGIAFLFAAPGIITLLYPQATGAVLSISHLAHMANAHVASFKR